MLDTYTYVERCGRARLFFFEETIDVTRLSALVIVSVLTLVIVSVFLILGSVLALYA